MKISIQDEIKRLIEVYKSTEVLRQHGYEEVLNEIMSDRAAVSHIMKKYDMVWRDNIFDFTELSDLWRNLLDKAQNTPNVDEKVINALFSHIIDMKNCRPDSLEDTEEMKEFNADTYANNGYGFSEIEDDIASEPEEEYGYGKKANKYNDDGWISIRRGLKKPELNKPVLIAGWYYAGAVQTLIGKRTGINTWEYERQEEFTGPVFTPLLWRELPDVPESILDEIPDVN